MDSKSKYLVVGVALLFSSIIISCKKEPEETIENDVITTVKVTVTDTTTGVTPVTYTFKDLDGEGGNDPVSDTMIFHPGKYYELTLDFSNERQTPTQSVTAEINANKEEHQIFFKPTPAGSLNTFMYMDTDGNGKPLGLKVSYYTQVALVNGSLEIILRHFPNKSAANVSSGDITNAGGESEVEIDFPFRLE